MLSSYLESPVFPEYSNCSVVFDYSLIRPAGSLLSTSNGKAPGPEPLRRSLEVIRKLLNQRIDEGFERLRPIDAYDILMHSSDAVLSGGVRRSASLIMFSPDDEEMASAKTGNWYYENPQRARSNNSALLIRKQTKKEDFLNLVSHTKQFGEPGFIFAEDTESIFNPCVEINLYAYDEFGNSGWHACNLTEGNGKLIKSKEDFAIMARASAIIGTAQAGYTDFHYLGEVTERIVRREALLGVSITGMMENPDILFDPAIQREMAELVKEVNVDIAKKIGINPAARCTCLKPAGTTSCLLGTSSGIHPHHSRRYFRHVQANRLEEAFQFFSTINPDAIEPSVWSASKNDSVVAFCIEASPQAITKEDLTAIELLQKVKSTQQNWVAPGTRHESCVKPWLVHNVSNTINLKDEEWDKVADFIYENKEFFAGISLLPMSGDKDYAQAPFCAVYTREEIEAKCGKEAYTEAFDLVKEALELYSNLWHACDAVMGNADNNEDNITAFDRSLWLDSVKEFSKNYFAGDVRKATYCLKDVFNWQKWCKLKASYKDVDYIDMNEDEDNTKPMETVACAGGVCEISF